MHIEPKYETKRMKRAEISVGILKNKKNKNEILHGLAKDNKKTCQILQTNRN